MTTPNNIENSVDLSPEGMRRDIDAILSRLDHMSHQIQRFLPVDTTQPGTDFSRVKTIIESSGSEDMT